MPTFKDYFKFLENSGAAEEGSILCFFDFEMEAFGLDANYGLVYFSDFVIEALGENVVKGTITLPFFSVDGRNATTTEIQFPQFQIEAAGSQEVSIEVYLPALEIFANGSNLPKAVCTMEEFYMYAFGGPAINIYRLCHNENSGL